MKNKEEFLTLDPRQSLDAALWNDDLEPAQASKRTWGWLHIFSLWVGMVISVPAYLLASGLMHEGMSPLQAIITVLLGNLVVLVPMILIGHAGAKYGIPFPVLLRSSFGTVGARLPGVLRSLVACGWFGIQTWVGGFAIYQILNGLFSGAFVGQPLPFIGIDPAQLLCFLSFWALQVYFIAKGMESIKWLETFAAPLLLLIGVALFVWAYTNTDGLSGTFSQPSAFVTGGEKEGQFWSVFWPGLTAMVGFWATLSLNIPDFTRFSKSQKDQIIGQAAGLPLPMALLGFVSVSVTSATVVIYGEQIWDPVDIAGRMGGLTALFGLVLLIIATITTNLAANVVAPANGFSNLAPNKISFRSGGFLTAALGIAIMPWKLMESAGAYLFVWLVGYSSLLGPIAGILIADYFIVRKCRLQLQALYQRGGAYEYSHGWNLKALLAFAVAVLPNVPGFLVAGGVIDSAPAMFVELYNYAWFVGALLGGFLYTLLMRLPQLGSAQDTLATVPASSD
ncbi:NCS1 family nucleobase:cation symporter-1 [Aestuariicella hydrocarbonica]|uniref:NCS1 family nucleobase:cation symporter-1 n=1 Tax=Pseudomaricurvus hydrocarbonicus TaxID=1470433 RepID=A0A9E5MHF8_9GAMM|nr:NCS1 family nucleobase:cation symporter-1 [Aestuariicella hydrocarbonica]NHO65886.1 NCS1 family nucleobase:cation symporter-1 [Aestuariicella hydrocarbonica]